MSKISSGTTTATGLVQTSDTTGNLELQTNNGTTAVTFDTNQNASFAGAVSINNGNYLSSQPTFRNIIINGDMRIAQRGTSTTFQYANGYYTADRWKMSVDNSWYSEFNIDVVTDVPDGQGFANALKYSIGYNGGNSGGANLKIQQRIEGQNIQHLKKGTSNAESLTLSFWVKSNKTGTYIAELYDVDNTRSISKSYTINTADTWEKKTITYAGDTTGTFGNDNNASLDVNLFLIAASAYTSGTLQTSWGTVTNANRAVGQVDFLDNNSNYYTVTGVQLEVGDTATPFEHRPYDIELARCLRYYFKHSYDGSNTFYGVGHCRSNYMRGMLHLPIPMRTNPTMSNTGTDADYELVSGTVEYTSFVQRPTRDGGSPYVVNFRVQVSSLTNGHAAVLTMKSTSSYLEFSAEL